MDWFRIFSQSEIGGEKRIYQHLSEPSCAEFTIVLASSGSCEIPSDLSRPLRAASGVEGTS